MTNCILYFIFTQKNHRNVAHTQHSHKVAEILNTTHSFMQLLYCIKSPKTRQKNTHNNNKGRRRQTAQQQHWRSVALFLLSLSMSANACKNTSNTDTLSSHTHTRTHTLILSLTLLQGVCLPAHVCHWYLWCVFVICMCVCACVITIAFAPYVRRGR